MAKSLSAERAGAVSPAVSEGFKGFTGTSIYAGYYDEEYLHVLTGSRAIATYDEMRRGDTQVRMLLKAIKDQLRSSRFQFSREKIGKADARIADFLDNAWFKNPRLDFPQYLNEVISYLDFGYCIHELFFAPSADRRGHTIGGLGWRSQKTIDKWIVDNTGLIAVEQMVLGDTVGKTGSQCVTMPANTLVLHTNDREGDNYEGISLLRYCYGPWLRKNLLLKINAIGSEKAAIGVPIGHYPKGCDPAGVEVASFIEILQKFAAHESSFICVPEGYEVDVTKIDFDSSKLMESIRYEDTAIIKTVLFQFLELGQGGNGGSFALGADQSDFALASMQHIGDYIASRIDLVNRALVTAEFGPSAEVPAAKCVGINSKAGKELADVIASMIEKGVINPDDELDTFVRSTYGMPKPEKTRADKAKEDEGNVNETAALNGAQISSLLELLTKTATGELPRETAVQLITAAFPIDTKRAEKLVGKIGKGFKPTLPVDAPARKPGAKFSDTVTYRRSLSIYEQSLNFAEIAAEFDSEKDKLLRLMKSQLSVIGERSLRAVEQMLKKAPNDRTQAAAEFFVNTKQYEKYLATQLAAIAAAGSRQAQKELATKAREAKFAEPLSKDLEFLPKDLRNAIVLQAKQQAAAHGAQVEKIVAFGIMSGVDAGMSDKQIISDLEDSLSEFTDGNGLESAAGTAVSQGINRGRNGFMFNKENLREIQAFQYSAVLDPNTTDICLSLDGQIFKPSDPDATRLRPPNHYNCRSILVPITINEPEPTITGLDMDASNPALVEEYARRGTSVPNLQRIKKSRNL